jgi:hypothetical protein
VTSFRSNYTTLRYSSTVRVSRNSRRVRRSETSNPQTDRRPAQIAPIVQGEDGTKISAPPRIECFAAALSPFLFAEE